MMGGHYSLAELYGKERKYDSAIYYYDTFLKEPEPSDMYIREQYLGLTYKALYECYQNLASNSVNKIIELNEKRIAKDGNNVGHLLDILVGSYMGIEQDSFMKNMHCLWQDAYKRFIHLMRILGPLQLMTSSLS
jgi:hypothetical protein